MRRFVALKIEDGIAVPIGGFTGAKPGDAARKAARKGYNPVLLREKGTKKVHAYRGKRVTKPTPPGSPEWMGETYTEGHTDKLGVIHFKRLAEIEIGLDSKLEKLIASKAE